MGGYTPESEEYKVTFDSGMASPDILPIASATPEPSTLTLLALARSARLRLETAETGIRLNVPVN
jgi:hypothetical protein